jgi:hypothetical protein
VEGPGGGGWYAAVVEVVVDGRELVCLVEVQQGFTGEPHGPHSTAKATGTRLDAGAHQFSVSASQAESAARCRSQSDAWPRSMSQGCGSIGPWSVIRCPQVAQVHRRVG